MSLRRAHKCFLPLVTNGALHLSGKKNEHRRAGILVNIHPCVIFCYSYFVRSTRSIVLFIISLLRHSCLTFIASTLAGGLYSLPGGLMQPKINAVKCS